MAPKVSRDLEQDQEVITKVKPPSQFKVILLNDDFTTMEFVIYVLQKFFHKTYEDAFQVMTEVHEKGSGLCGIYSYDIARTKADQVQQEAQNKNYPLKCIIEKDSGDEEND